MRASGRKTNYGMTLSLGSSVEHLSRQHTLFSTLEDTSHPTLTSKYKSASRLHSTSPPSLPGLPAVAIHSRKGLTGRA